MYKAASYETIFFNILPQNTSPVELFLKSYLKKANKNYLKTLASSHGNSKDLLSSFLAMRQVDISFECTLHGALMQRLLPRVPKWVGQQC